MDRDEIRRRLEGTCPPAGAALQTPVPASVIPAAVLIGLAARPEGPHVILTERTAHLRDHPSEISLPGGRLEPGDVGPAGAALREAFEEIGLPPANVEIMGCLPPYRTISAYCVYPIVGWIDRPLDFVLDAREVADVFEVPLSFVLDPANHHRDSLEYQGVSRSFYVLPFPGRRIWGATAAILVELARVLGP